MDHIRRRRAGGGPHRAGDERGFALIAVLVFAFVMILVGMAFYRVAGYELNQAEYQRDYAQAFWAAETALDRGVDWLEHPVGGQPPLNVVDLYTGTVIGDATYDLSVTPDPGNFFNPDKTFTLRATGRSGRAGRVLVEVVKTQGFARYGYFTNNEQAAGGGDIWFFSGDDLGGKIHTNGTFHIAGNPRFRGHVTSASDHMVAYPGTNVYGPGGFPSGSNNPTFDQGFELGVNQINLPNDTGDLRIAAQSGGISLTGNYDVEFQRSGQPPGTVSYRPTGGAGAWVDVAVSSLSRPVIHVDGTMSLSGIVQGLITVAASHNVELIGPLRYASADPVTGQPAGGSHDIAGIVAGQNVVVKDVAANRTGDMVIDATVMALNTSFGAENYSSGAPRGVLHLWGGLIQDHRGAVGTFSGGVTQSGYVKDYHYDDRVTAQPPPEFPLTNEYQRVSWREEAPA